MSPLEDAEEDNGEAAMWCNGGETHGRRARFVSKWEEALLVYRLVGQGC